MSLPVWIAVYSNGNVWYFNDGEYLPGATQVNASSQPKSAEAGTLVKVFRINSDAKAQKITTLTGSGNSSSSALAASGGATTKAAAVELT